MKQREHPHYTVFFRGDKHLLNRLHIRENVIMRQHHSFGSAGTATRKDDRGKVVWRLTFPIANSLEQAGRSEESHDCGPYSCESRDVLQNVFDEHHAVEFFEVGLVEEGT